MMDRQGLIRRFSVILICVILDLMLPGVDGFEICRKGSCGKEYTDHHGICEKDDIDKIRGLGLGADDYMTNRLVQASWWQGVKAHLARYERLIGSAVEENKVIEIRGLKIDTTTARRVWVKRSGEEFYNKRV